MADVPDEGGRPQEERPQDEPSLDEGGRPQDTPVESGDEVSADDPRGRQSVAATRRPTSNKSTLILGAISIVGIIVVIVIGFWMNARANAIPDDGYGTSRHSVATVDAQGVITVRAVPGAVSASSADGASVSPTARSSSADDEVLTLDLYVDAIDPDCAAFEHQFGQQIAKAIDEGTLVVRYHVLDFLNKGSTSGDYSTRAYAALLDVARIDGDRPGVFSKVYAALWDSANQPKTVPEGAKSDLDNAALAQLAGAAGASEDAQHAIAAGTSVATAKADAQHALAALTAAWKESGGPAQTPSVTENGSLISTNDVGWLSQRLQD